MHFKWTLPKTEFFFPHQADERLRGGGVIYAWQINWFPIKWSYANLLNHMQNNQKQNGKQSFFIGPEMSFDMFNVFKCICVSAGGGN